MLWDVCKLIESTAWKTRSVQWKTTQINPITRKCNRLIIVLWDGILFHISKERGTEYREYNFKARHHIFYGPNTGQYATTVSA